MSDHHHAERAADVIRPLAPPPTSTSSMVREYLIQFFLALNCERTLSEATELAAKLNVDGIALYEMPERIFIHEYGYEGSTIYNALCRSKYGYKYSIAALGRSFGWLGSCLHLPECITHSLPFGQNRSKETWQFLSPAQPAPLLSRSSICPAEAKLQLTQDGFQKYSRSDSQEDSGSDGMRFRRHYYQDID